MLPHIGVIDGMQVKKAYYLGYMIHKMLSVALGRRPVDDRDHYGNKRLDLAGNLLASLFRALFRKMSKEMQIYLQKAVDRQADYNLMAAGTKIFDENSFFKSVFFHFFLLFEK